MSKVLVRLTVEENGTISHALYLDEKLVTKELYPSVEEALTCFLHERVIDSLFDFSYEIDGVNFVRTEVAEG